MGPTQRHTLDFFWAGLNIFSYRVLDINNGKKVFSTKNICLLAVGLSHNRLFKKEFRNRFPWSIKHIQL